MASDMTSCLQAVSQSLQWQQQGHQFLKVLQQARQLARHLHYLHPGIGRYLRNNTVKRFLQTGLLQPAPTVSDSHSAAHHHEPSAPKQHQCMPSSRKRPWWVTCLAAQCRGRDCHPGQLWSAGSKVAVGPASCSGQVNASRLMVLKSACPEAPHFNPHILQASSCCLGRLRGGRDRPTGCARLPAHYAGVSSPEGPGNRCQAAGTAAPGCV